MRARVFGARHAGRGGVVVKVAAAVAVLGTGACKPLDDVMVWGVSFIERDGRSMRNSRSYDPYENTLAPAPGSVPFSAGNYTSSPTDRNVGHPTPVEYDLPPFVSDPTLAMAAITANVALYDALQNPVPADQASIARGQMLFERGCAICHGPAGDVSKAPILDKLGMMIAFNLVTGPARGFTDGYIYGMIRQGRGIMPSYGHQFAHYDRWHIVNYIRSLQSGGAAPAGAPAAGAPAAPPAGSAPAAPPPQERED
jgi:mono/diheme cytochrome c family protein